MSIETTYSQTRAQLATLMNRVSDDREVVIVKRRDHPAVASIERVATRLVSDEPPTPALRGLLLEGAASAPGAAADSAYFEALRDGIRSRAGGL